MTETSSKEEITFYQDLNVTVTPSRYVTNSKTYAMRNISSVHTFEIVKSKTLPVILILVGLLFALINEAKIIGFILLAIGFITLFLIENEFAVRISTTSGEVNSIVSKDKTYVQKIVDALNDAIIHRG